MRRWFVLSAALVLGCPQTIVVDDDDGAIDDGDAGVTIDAGFGGDGGSSADAGRGDADPADAGDVFECFVDPFSVCPDPDEAMRTNNEWTSAGPIHSTSAGCQRADEFEALDVSVTSRLCQTEPADFYRLTVVPCDTRTMIATVRLRVVDSCPADRVALGFFSAGGRLDCDEPDDEITCSVDQGDFVIQRLVPPGNSVLSWQFGVESDHGDVAFDYTLSVRLD